jgi:hypothetical protein
VSVVSLSGYAPPLGWAAWLCCCRRAPIDVGSSNGSAGDSWRLGGIFPAGSVSSVKRDYQSDCEEPAPGCGGQLAFVIQISDDIPEGKIMFAVKNCYQSVCPEDPRATPDSKSFKYELTVVNQR